MLLQGQVQHLKTMPMILLALRGFNQSVAIEILEQHYIHTICVISYDFLVITRKSKNAH